jgi:hypothetical protein
VFYRNCRVIIGLQIQIAVQNRNNLRLLCIGKLPTASAARCSAIEAPIPFEAPVITATLLVSLPLIFLVQLRDS